MNCVPAQIAIFVFRNVMPFEVVVVGGLDVEQIEVVAAVEDHLAVAGRLDHDRFLRRALRREVVGPFERRRRVDRRLVAVELVVIRVGAGVDQDRVARLDARPSARRRVAGAAPVVVGAHDAFERRLDLLALPLRRIHVIRLAAFGRHRLRTRAHRHDLRRVRRGPPTPSGSVITKRASYAVPGSRSRMLPANMFGVTRLKTLRWNTCSPCSRSSGIACAPRGLTLLAIRDLDARIAIRIAVDVPLEARG